jgi:hypothetical protein
MSGDLTVARPAPIGVPLEPEAHPATDADGSATAQPDDPSDALPTPPAAPVVNGAIAVAYEEARLRILRSLERGEIDVAEAGHRLEALDSGPDDPGPPSGVTSDA